MKRSCYHEEIICITGWTRTGVLSCRVLQLCCARLQYNSKSRTVCFAQSDGFGDAGRCGGGGREYPGRIFFSDRQYGGGRKLYCSRNKRRTSLQLEPVEPYTDDDLNWTDENSRVVYEHDNPDARDVELVATTVPDWETYDTVFIGYPIWWGIAAWPVDGFVEANDFTDKTVIPFCTSSSSGLGESGELLADMAGTGNWLEGHRFSSGVTEADVQTWVEGLEL